MAPAAALLAVLLLPLAAQGADGAPWSGKTESPRRAKAGGSEPIYAICGERDLGLVQVAHQLLRSRLRGEPPPDQREVRNMLRRAGVPQVWPRAWSVAGEHDQAKLHESLRLWAQAKPAQGVPRCGFARGADSKGEPVVAAVRVDALADLAALPRRVRSSDWISFDGRMLRHADQVKITLLGPSGRPSRVLASLSEGTIRSRFRLDRSGRWLVQAMAHTATGPRPVLETVIFANVDPSEAAPQSPRTPSSGAQTAAQLLRLMNRERKRERLGKLVRDGRLDKLADAHARALAHAGRISHDLGRGSPEQRVAASDVRAHQVGENLASAGSVEAAHQALWESPSHRENMLDPAFSRVGIGLKRDRRGRLWAVELMTN